MRELVTHAGDRCTGVNFAERTRCTEEAEGANAGRNREAAECVSWIAKVKQQLRMTFVEEEEEEEKGGICQKLSGE